MAGYDEFLEERYVILITRTADGAARTITAANHLTLILQRLGPLRNNKNVWFNRCDAHGEDYKDAHNIQSFMMITEASSLKRIQAGGLQRGPGAKTEENES